ncbi:glutathione synthase [Sphingomonas kaistensis]|uniref:Glutathione synthetase n=1 Tax=Sphingomonas kaistensis TaxID=298708 RepID=A0A7X5Y8E7_9SPHN|nr:glutathione synthase [Sphingomonas kaistensis]NJC06901.1 glutathione synthase [Sphingomonas kaistensis]
MSLTVAVQMDPLESINIDGDSTFALMLEAQGRGHRLFEYPADALTYEDGALRARARPVTVKRAHGEHFAPGDPTSLDLAEDVDVILMRQDPPFDMGYITAAHLLERLDGKTLVVNDPANVRSAPEKLWVLDFARFMPPTLITRSMEELTAFRARHGEIVVKPLHGNAGAAVFRIGHDGSNLRALAELFSETWKEPFIAQAFLPAVSEGDKRIILVDGDPIGAINRVPGAGEIRSNLAAGGTAHRTDLSDREREICEALGPELRRRGLLFVGIDVIGGMLTEINVTSPTGLVALDRFEGINSAGLIWDAIERKLGRGDVRG